MGRKAARAPELPSYRDAIRAGREKSARRYLQEILRASRGNVTRAAMRAGLERESFYRLLRRYEIRPDDYRG